MLGEEIQRALPRQLGGRLVVRAALVTVETVIGLIHKHLHPSLRLFNDSTVSIGIQWSFSPKCAITGHRGLRCASASVVTPPP